MIKPILIILTLAGFASGAEFEIPARLSVDGSSMFRSSVAVVNASTQTPYSLAVGTSTNYSFTVSTCGRLQANEIYRGTYSVLDASMLDTNGSMKVTGIQNTGATAGISVSAQTADRGLDYMEYSSTDAAQAAYITNGGLDANTKLLIHFDGADAATANTAETGQIVTFAGTAKLSTAQKEFGTAGLWLDGSSGYVSVPGNGDWNFGTGAFTIDMWTYIDTTHDQNFFSQRTDDSNYTEFNWYATTNQFRVNNYFNGAATVWFIASWTPTSNTWHHLALVRIDNGNTFASWRIFVDGSALTLTLYNGAWNGAFGRTDTPLIGFANPNMIYFKGYMDEFRMSKGIARWTTTFTKPTAPYAPALQDYSEPAIKTQGSYSLKGVAAITDSLNKSLTRTISTPLDLSGRTQINFDIRSSTTGSNIKIGLHDSGGTTTEITPNIILSDTWQTVNWDISAVTDTNKEAVDSIIITITSASATNTFYVDNIFAPGGGTTKDITFTTAVSERMRIDGTGNVGIGTTVPGVKLDVNGVANSNYEGFSYSTNGYTKSSGWNPVIENTLNFNTFGIITYDTITGTFTAPKAGYYRFSSGGYIGTASTSNDQRIAIGIYKNGVLCAMSGGQFSVGDTPGPQFTHVVYLAAGDTVRTYSWTPIDAVFGGTTVGNNWWFQGEYVGK